MLHCRLLEIGRAEMRWVISYEDANDRHWIRCLDQQGWHQHVLKREDLSLLRSYAQSLDPNAEIEEPS